MKSRIALSVLFVLIAATAFAADTVYQPHATPVPSDAQKSFDNHENPGGRVGRPRHRPGRAGDVRRQNAPLAARHLARKRARARVSGSRNAVGCDQVRPSGHDALRGRRPAHADSLLRCGEPAAHDRQDVARRQDGRVRTQGHQRKHRSTTCTIRCSPSSTPTITPRIGRS